MLQADGNAQCRRVFRPGPNLRWLREPDDRLPPLIGGIDKRGAVAKGCPHSAAIRLERRGDEPIAESCDAGVRELGDLRMTQHQIGLVVGRHQGKDPDLVGCDG